MAPSGTGKTTLLNVLGCLMKASSGSYIFEDQDVATLNDDHLSEIRNKRSGLFSNIQSSGKNKRAR